MFDPVGEIRQIVVRLHERRHELMNHCSLSVSLSCWIIEKLETELLDPLDEAVQLGLVSHVARQDSGTGDA